tara:strand:+ start:129 stop:335 length:207 start_codon:yes stop_codon:yes gene_type:complete
MHVSQLKTGLKVKIDIKEGMEVIGGEDLEGFVTAFFGNKPKIQQWMKDYNLFEHKPGAFSHALAVSQA